jgi:integrase
MAYIHQHNDGWRAQVVKLGIRRTAVWPTKREAQTWATRLEAEIDAGKHKAFPDKTLQQAVSKYLATVSTTKVNAVNWEARRFDALMAHLGDVPLTSITSETIGDWRDTRLKTVSGSTVLREVNLYRNLFKIAAEEWKWVEASPFKGVRLPRANQPRTGLWGWREIRRVLRAPRDGKTKEMIDAFHISLRTGMRLKEVLAAPANYDPKRRVVTVDSKTGRAAQIPIGRIAHKLLLRPAFAVGPNEGSVLFSKLLRQLLIDGLTFHDARATALTHLSSKVDVLTLAKISRHKDLSILSNVYYRTTADDIARLI